MSKFFTCPMHLFSRVWAYVIRFKKDRSRRQAIGCWPGRKAKYKDTVTIAATVPGEVREQLDQWANDHELNRSQALVEAIRRLVKSRR